MTIDFTAKPTTEPPKTGAWVWAGDSWVEVSTDTGDGVPESLDLDGDSLAADRTPVAVHVGGTVLLGSAPSVTP